MPTGGGEGGGEGGGAIGVGPKRKGLGCVPEKKGANANAEYSESRLPSVK